MIDITERPNKCYAEVMGQCVVLIRTECEGCRFYKPRDCEDWVRVDKDGKEYLMTPEEFDTIAESGERIKGWEYI